VRFAVVLAALAVALGWAASPFAQESSQAVRYRVEVEAPEELKKMLQTGLTLVHWSATRR
jgi:hypothetical protein